MDAAEGAGDWTVTRLTATPHRTDSSRSKEANPAMFASKLPKLVLSLAFGIWEIWEAKRELGEI